LQRLFPIAADDGILYRIFDFSTQIDDRANELVLCQVQPKQVAGIPDQA